MENKIRIYQAANTSDISINNKIRTNQAASTSDVSIENKTQSTKQLTHLISE
jgi:hypothetical protein